MSAKLTVGMACYDDFDGVYFTIQALRFYHAEVMPHVELLVVDNKPDTKGSGYIKNLLENWVKGTAGARYIPMADPPGTTQSRNRVFSEASGEAVMCIDSHVMLAPGSLARLIQWYADHPDCKDLLGGPMLYDDLVSGNTHFDDVWRAEMWGIWGKAWLSPRGYHVTVLNTNGKCDFRQLGMGLSPIPEVPLDLPHAGHEKVLKGKGWKLLEDGDEPFAIPGQGLGLFTCRKDAWLGFNPHFRGFGGEEMYIHEKYRQAGHQALCLPWLKWSHRFGRPNGVPYVKVLTRWNKIRNYVLGLQELGLPLDRCYDHFVKGNLMPQWEWDALVANAIGSERGPGTPPPGTMLPKESTRPATGLAQPRSTIDTSGELLAWCKTLPRDLDQHLDTIAEYAARCQHVTEFTHRRESTVALLAAPKVLSYQAEHDGLIQRMLDIFPEKLDVVFFDLYSLPQPAAMWETDLTFIDTIGTANRLSQELAAYAPHTKKYIILHDTQLHAVKGSDDGPGLLEAMRAFMRKHPEWSVVYHTHKQYGLTVLSRCPEDKPKLPTMMTMAGNLAKAAAEYVSDGMKNVTKEQYEQRLNICSLCDQRTDNRCSVCGCGLATKAAGRAFDCPLGKWPLVSPKEEATPANG